MKSQGFVLALMLALFPASAIPQSKPAPDAAASVVVKAAKLLDVRKGTYIENAAMWIEGERIKEVGPASDIQSHAPKNAKVIDLGRATVLPGLIDCHTHILARMPDTDDGYTLDLATKSQAFRALEGAFNARLTLNAGFYGHPRRRE
jgi:imidazolonepropionase-like amidohydrolase